MPPPRYFVRAPYANTIEDFANWAAKHGRPIVIHCHRAFDGKSIAGSAEIDIEPDLPYPLDEEKG